MIDLSDISLQLSNSPFVQHGLKSLEDINSDIYFSIAVNKDQIFREKKRLLEKNNLRKLIVVNNATNYGNLNRSTVWGDIIFIHARDVKNINTNNLKILELLNNSIVFFTSNVFAEIGAKKMGWLYSQTSEAVYVIHDYDNHHWLENNLQAAIFSDVYVPAHQGDFLLPGRVNRNILGGVPCGSNQWSREFISQQVSSLLDIKRLNSPLGKYYLYKNFTYRNKVIATLSKIYPSVGLIKDDFHAKSPQEKWGEWVQHKLHWIIPVLNDLPIRFFDALITGGLPLIPCSLESYAKNLGIPKEFYVVYSPIDILEPENFVSQQIERFDKLGNEGILARHQFSMNKFHIDQIYSSIIRSTLTIYEQENFSV